MFLEFFIHPSLLYCSYIFFGFMYSFLCVTSVVPHITSPLNIGTKRFVGIFIFGSSVFPYFFMEHNFFLFYLLHIFWFYVFITL